MTSPHGSRRTRLAVVFLFGAALLAAIFFVLVALHPGDEIARFAAATTALKSGPGSNIALRDSTVYDRSAGSTAGGVRAATSTVWLTNLDDATIRSLVEAQLTRDGFRPAPAPISTDDNRRSLGRWRVGVRVYRLLAGRLPMRVAGHEVGGAKTAVFGLLTDEPGAP